MTTHAYEDQELEKLKGKTILIFGAATGIGRAAVERAHRYGANIAIGDWNEAEGREFEKQLNERVLFMKCDVSKWDDILDVFEATWKTFGTIHSVLANAGIHKEGLLEDDFDAASGRLKAPSLDTLDVNLTGTLYITKCAVHYFSKWPETRCQLIMTGSAASLLDCPPLHIYCATKAGILGLMRGLRIDLVKKNITTNVIMPWMTVTNMMPEWIKDLWGTLPSNTTDAVGRALLLPIIRPELNGKSFFVAGHQIIEVEDKLHEAQPMWLGEELSKDVDEGQRRLLPGWSDTIVSYRSDKGV